MKIKIKESQYTKLNEAVGVPTNIVSVAQQLFDKIISEINPNDDINTFLKKKNQPSKITNRMTTVQIILFLVKKALI